MAIFSLLFCLKIRSNIKDNFGYICYKKFIFIMKLFKKCAKIKAGSKRNAQMV